MDLKQILIDWTSMSTLERKTLIAEKGDQLVSNMLQEIGSVDAELRDQLIYRTFMEMIGDQLLSLEQMQLLFEETVTEKYLFFHTGDEQTDTVFTRSFSALLLTGILTVDAELRFLPEKMLVTYLERSDQFLQKERDVRGFVDGKGWAHSVAHGADLAAATVRHPAFELRMAPPILQAIKACLWKDVVYVDDEEERLIEVIEAMMKKGVSDDVLIEWVEQVFDKLDHYLNSRGYDPSYFKARTCTLHFMKTLYFALKIKKSMPKLEGVVYMQVAKHFKLG
ncbi:DUF2785 domain-containing protein [Viridibacillus sp. YIM B01967]|uniref:DUF2785 domain-containing protein n=1 Tax=Viridibacillus soli TaxID=2798301 RepID=A0ABS1H5J8_9BACL|nr:DUF2785 domain-containing protein [Viridibacillus soli]MBK3494690.1 DUF2785 domain-containing protein [Viridibacillus soli]